MPFILKPFTPLVDFPAWMFEKLSLMTELEDECLNTVLTFFAEGRVDRDSFVKQMRLCLVKAPYACLGFGFKDFYSWRTRCINAAIEDESKHPLTYCGNPVLAKTAAESWEEYEVVQQERRGRIIKVVEGFDVNVLDSIYPELHTKIKSLLAAVDIPIFFNASNFTSVFSPVVFSTNFDHHGYFTTVYKRLADSGDPEAYRLFSGLSQEDAADLFC
jgi:hypothetical protein